MSIALSNYILEELELLLNTISYRIGYEKGNFKTGTCIIERGKTFVINKFSNIKSKISSIIELIKVLEIDQSFFSKKQKQYYYSFFQTSITF